MRSPHLLQLCVLAIASLLTETGSAQPSDWAPAILPESTVIYAEFGPVQTLLKHPIRGRIQSSEVFKELWKSPEVLKLRGGITLAELALGDRVENVASKLGHGGFVAAIDGKSQGAALIFQSEGKEWLKEYVHRLRKLAKDDAKNKNQDDPVKEANYRGVEAYQFHEAIIGLMDDRLLVTNKSELGKAIVDAWKDASGSNRLSDKSSFQEARQANKVLGIAASGSHEMGWMFVDIPALRDAGVAKELLGGKAKDFGAELILGGLLATLHKTDSVIGRLLLEESSIRLLLESPHDPNWVGQERAYFVGENHQGFALPLLMPEGAMASLSTFRDVSQMWLRAGDLFNQEVNDQLAQADNTLTTLFSGRDFGEEILGAMEPQLRLVAARQVFASGEPTPAIKLPGFALVAKLKQPEKMRPELKRIFQSFIGFLNIVGAMEGRTQFDLNMEKDGERQYVSANYVPEVDRKSHDEAPIQFNFSPCLAFTGDVAILSSTIPLAKQLVASVEGDSVTSHDPAKATANTLVDMDVQALKEILQDNHRQLVSQNVLEKGHSRQEAEKEIGTLLRILDLFQRGALSLSFTDKARLELSAELAK